MNADAHEEHPHQLKENTSWHSPHCPPSSAPTRCKSLQVRAERSELKKLLKQGDKSLPAVLAEAATNDAIAKMKVMALVQAMPGVGTVRAKQIMTRLGITETRRVQGLGVDQRQALEAEFASA